MSVIYEKAVIKIISNKVEEVEEEEVSTPLSNTSALSGIAGITSKLKQTASLVQGKDLLGMVSTLMRQNKGDSESFLVQFNPSNIKISVCGKKSEPKTGADVKRRRSSYGLLGIQKEVSFELYFDQLEKDMKNVQKLRNSFRNPYTRYISFSWGNQFYEGELKDLKITYTMFSNKGEPIQASVGVSILCK